MLNKKPKKDLRTSHLHCNFALQEWLQLKHRVGNALVVMPDKVEVWQNKTYALGECNEIFY